MQMENYIYMIFWEQKKKWVARFNINVYGRKTHFLYLKYKE